MRTYNLDAVAQVLKLLRLVGDRKDELTHIIYAFGGDAGNHRATRRAEVDNANSKHQRRHKRRLVTSPSEAVKYDAEDDCGYEYPDKPAKQDVPSCDDQPWSTQNRIHDTLKPARHRMIQSIANQGTLCAAYDL